jgi:hypothetical protein
MEKEKSDLQPIKAGVPQGRVLGPTLCTPFTSDLPTSSDITTGTFADYIAIFSVSKYPERAASDLQHHLNLLKKFFEKWRIKFNENKSCYIAFTIQKNPDT